MYIKIDENKRVIMRIADKFAEGMECDNVTTFRVAHNLISVNNDEVLYYNPDTDIFRIEKIEYTEEQIAKTKAMNEAGAKKAKALKWLADNDWKVNKRVLGEWEEEDPRWQEYVEGRIKARADIDEADAVLSTLK
jgi:hypothetical protein